VDEVEVVAVNIVEVGQQRRRGDVAPAACCRACQRKRDKDDDPLLPVFCDETVSGLIGLAIGPVRWAGDSLFFLLCFLLFIFCIFWFQFYYLNSISAIF
jgi:hypothetical protein